MSVGQAAAQLAAGIPAMSAVTGTYLGQDGGRARVQAPAGVVLASKASGDWPGIGATVWLLTVGGELLMLGSPSGTSWGVASAVGTGTVVVEYPEGSGLLATYLLPRGATAVVGDRVLLDHGRSVVVAAYPTAVAPTPTPAPSDGATTAPREAEVNAAWDGTATPAGYWIDGRLLYTRNNSGGPNYATIGYGDGVTRLGIDPATITEAHVFIAREKVGSAHTGGVHALGGPAGTVTPADTFAVATTDGWLAIPLDAARAIASGSASGLTFYGGTGTVLRGIAASRGNGRLRIRYAVEG